jgi:hypothetical protein
MRIDSPSRHPTKTNNPYSYPKPLATGVITCTEAVSWVTARLVIESELLQNTFTYIRQSSSLTVVIVFGA